jgi:hypothetical protein
VPPLITAAQAREHIETDLIDAALTRLINDADAAIVDRYGPHTGDVTVDLEGEGAQIFLDRPVGAVTSVTEYVVRQDATGVVLAANDWRALGGHRLERLNTGTNPRSTWGERIVLVYAPADEAARRTFMTVDLVKLAAKYEALESEGIGDYRATHVKYERERQAILGRMRGRRLPFG